MKKFIINSIILLLFIAAIVLGIYVLNEYIIQNDTVAEVFHQGYDEVKTISKNEEQNVENPIENIQKERQNVQSRYYYSQRQRFSGSPRR